MSFQDFQKLFKKIFNLFHYLFQLGPWLAVEIPELIERGVVVYKEKNEA